MDRKQLARESIRQIRERRFDWAQWNCGIAAAKVAEPYSGIDYSKDWPTGLSMLSALRIVKKAGGLDKMVESLGLRQIAEDRAEIGDFALGQINIGNGPSIIRQTLGIVCDDGRAVFPSKYGYFYLDLKNCVKLWRVETND